MGFRKNEAKDVSGGEGEGNRDLMKVDVVDLEERVKKELKSVQLLGEHDEVSCVPPSASGVLELR